MCATRDAGGTVLEFETSWKGFARGELGEKSQGTAGQTKCKG